MQCEAPEFVMLDSSAIENLELFVDSQGKASGSLLASIDHCNTPFGKRLLKKWISKPLARLADIKERQDAVEDLLTTSAAAAGRARQRLTRVGDLERQIVRLLSSSLKGAHGGRDAEHVILYEDVTKKRVSALCKALEGLHSVNEAIHHFHVSSANIRSSLLKKIVAPDSQFPGMTAILNAMKASANWEEAKKTGHITPAPVMTLFPFRDTI